MRTIYKFPIPLSETVKIKTHAGAQIVHIGFQNNTLTVWAEVDTDRPRCDEALKLKIFGTGHEMPINNKEHVGTVMMGEFVWHIYRVFA